MELKDFIKNTISSIGEAISESQEELKSKNILVNPERYDITENGDKKFAKFKDSNRRHIQTLEFDILVGVESKQDSTRGIGVQVIKVLNIGNEKSKIQTNANQNRIKFEIPIAFSTIKTPEEYLGSEIGVK
ncbi:MAG: hypothetical protein GX796_11545 [Clostridiaceae bacterium]|nr:hypothetical protein [Clostridiaceae bacterium]